MTIPLRCTVYRPGDIGPACSFTCRVMGAVQAMRQPLTFQRLREQNARRCAEVFHPKGGMREWSVLEWAGAMSGEAGEAAEALFHLLIAVGKATNYAKKLRRLDTADKPNDTPEERRRLIGLLMREVADTVIYGDLLGLYVGGRLDEAIVEKFNEVSEQRGSDIRL